VEATSNSTTKKAVGCHLTLRLLLATEAAEGWLGGPDPHSCALLEFNINYPKFNIN
jgi:hypothetical protein